MGSRQWVEWVHGVKEARIGSLPKPEEGEGKPVTEAQVFEDLTGRVLKEDQQKKARDIYTAHDMRPKGD